MEAFKMWERRIIFRNGRFLYTDEKGNNSIISRECARKKEEDYYGYQASMDVNRGGQRPESAYPSRGFSADKDYNWVYSREYKVDSLVKFQSVYPLLGNLTMPANVDGITINRIEKRAFLGCDKLRSIAIPDTVKSIGNKAFEGCKQLSKITFSEQIELIEEGAFEDTDFFNDKRNWNADALYLNNWLVKVESGVQGSFVIQDGTVGIADAAFIDCVNLKSVTIPNSTRYIGSRVFLGCSMLEEVVFPDKVTRFGVRVFDKCANLKRVDLPEGVTDLRGIFQQNRSLVSVTIPKSVRVIDSVSFAGTAYMKDQSNWADGALYLDNWLIKVDENVTGDFEIRQGTVGIADYAFGSTFDSGPHANPASVMIPDSVKYIGAYAFSNCKELKHINIPDSVEILKSGVFRNCSSLFELKVPMNVKKVESQCFYSCKRLKKLIIENPDAEMEWPCINSCPNVIIFGYANSTAEAYAKKYKIRFEAI